MVNIEIIGSVGGRMGYTPEQIAFFLNNEQVQLHYGSQFMGRPGTRLFSGEYEIVKLRSELKLNAKRIREWVLHTLETEKKLGVHHPEKCWFIAELEPGEFTAGSICPRLLPVHTFFADNPELSNENRLEVLKKIYQAYFRTARNFEKRLDEGLSNFGLDRQNNIFYLDDDLYSWDKFFSFSHILGILIRNNSWFDEDCTERFAAILLDQVNEYFQNSESCALIAGTLRDIHIPDKNKKKLFDLIIKKFQLNKTVSKKKRFSSRYMAILADVHANLPALDAVMEFLSRENIDQGFVIGDTVGYGPHPAECIDRLQNSSLEVIKGNHDHAAVTGDVRRGMSSTATWCIEWTIPRLNPAHLKWLDQLPLELSGNTESARRWLAVHGSPVDPYYFYGYVYDMTYEHNLDALEQRKIDLCFHGHAHVQGIYARKKKGSHDGFNNDKQQELQSYRHCLICPGSVGQPRDGALGAQLAIFDQRDQIITFHTLEYPFQETINTMKAEGFPEFLTTRLSKGV